MDQKTTTAILNKVNEARKRTAELAEAWRTLDRDNVLHLAGLLAASPNCGQVAVEVQDSFPVALVFWSFQGGTDEEPRWGTGVYLQALKERPVIERIAAGHNENFEQRVAMFARKNEEAG